MPGLCGIIDLGSNSSSQQISAMIEPLAPHPWFVVERCEELAHFRAAAVSLERSGRKPRVAISDDSSVACVLDGEFYNAAELALDYGASDDYVRRPALRSDSELLLSGWRKYGE